MSAFNKAWLVLKESSMYANEDRICEVCGEKKSPSDFGATDWKHSTICDDCAYKPLHDAIRDGSYERMGE